MWVNLRTRAMSALYKNDHRKVIASYRPLLFLNLDYKAYTIIIKSRIQKLLIIGESESASSKKITILRTLSIIWDTIDILETVNIRLAVIFLNISKAFDDVNLNFIFSANQSLYTGTNPLVRLNLLIPISSLK